MAAPRKRTRGSDDDDDNDDVIGNLRKALPARKKARTDEILPTSIPSHEASNTAVRLGLVDADELHELRLGQRQARVVQFRVQEDRREHAPLHDADCRESESDGSGGHAAEDDADARDSAGRRGAESDGSGSDIGRGGGGKRNRAARDSDDGGGSGEGGAGSDAGASGRRRASAASRRLLDSVLAASETGPADDFTEDGTRIVSFNVDDELAEGFIDAAGEYRARSAAAQGLEADGWADAVDDEWNAMRKARGGGGEPPAAGGGGGGRHGSDDDEASAGSAGSAGGGGDDEAAAMPKRAIVRATGFAGRATAAPATKGKKRGGKAAAAAAAASDDDDDDGDDDEAEAPTRAQRSAWLSDVIAALQPEENVLKALRRCKAAGDSAALLALTGWADALLLGGMATVYQDTRAELEAARDALAAAAAGAGAAATDAAVAAASAPAAGGCMWQYRLGGKEDVFGPFTSAQMREWRAWFAGEARADVRLVAGPGAAKRPNWVPYAMVNFERMP